MTVEQYSARNGVVEAKRGLGAVNPQWQPYDEMLAAMVANAGDARPSVAVMHGCATVGASRGSSAPHRAERGGGSHDDTQRARRGALEVDRVHRNVTITPNARASE